MGQCYGKAREKITNVLGALRPGCPHHSENPFAALERCATHKLAGLVLETARGEDAPAACPELAEGAAGGTAGATKSIGPAQQGGAYGKAGAYGGHHDQASLLELSLFNCRIHS
jgi:hypothetical protein